MIRRIIQINEEKCNGCGACASACHEGAIGMVNGKARLLRDDYCDGLGDCLPACPTGAMWADWDNRKIAEINKDECIGCGMCKRQCQFEAIVGEVKQPHVVTNACTGCGKCAEKCPKKCITMKVREHTRDANAKVGTTP